MSQTSKALGRGFVRTVLAITLTAVVGGCAWFGPSSDPDAIAEEQDLDLVPVIAFQAPSVAANVMPRSVVPDDIDYKEAYYVFMGPLIAGFRPNAGGQGPGDTLTYPFMGTTINVTITRAAGTFTFDGTLANGGGWLRMTYTPSTKIFAYEHALLIDDQHNVFGNDDDRFLYAVIYSVMDGIEMQPNGDFHGSYSGFVDFGLRDGEGEIIQDGSQGMRNAEIYSGPMILADGTTFGGVGIASYLAYNGARAEGITGLPTLTNVPLMKTTLDDLPNDELVEYPFLSIWNSDDDEFYDYSGDAGRFGTDPESLESLWDFTATEDDRALFINLLPTGGWQENTLQPPLP